MVALGTAKKQPKNAPQSAKSQCVVNLEGLPITKKNASKRSRNNGFGPALQVSIIIMGTILLFATAHTILSSKLCISNKIHFKNEAGVYL